MVIKFSKNPKNKRGNVTCQVGKLLIQLAYLFILCHLQDIFYCKGTYMIQKYQHKKLSDDIDTLPMNTHFDQSTRNLYHGNQICTCIYGHFHANLHCTNMYMNLHCCCKLLWNYSHQNRSEICQHRDKPDHHQKIQNCMCF